MGLHNAEELDNSYNVLCACIKNILWYLITWKKVRKKERKKYIDSWLITLNKINILLAWVNAMTLENANTDHKGKVPIKAAIPYFLN